MREHQSLDNLLAKKAVEFADQVKAAAAMADTEEEIRIEVERQLAFVQQEAGVKLQGKHEFTVASGRIDSVYNAVIIEYKNPSSPASRIGPGASSPGAKKVVEQIKSRFYDMRSKETLNTLFGVGCDGNYFIFVRFYNDKWQVQDPVEVNKHSAERFLWALFNLGTKGKRFEPDYLAGDFGSAEGSVASAGIKVLYDAISTTTNAKAQTFFSQWKILFGEVCGYDVDHPSDKIKKLADFYGVPTKGMKPAEMLFGVHTYYALFMKLLGGEIIGHFHKLPSLLQKLVNAPSANKLKETLDNLENRGGIFKELGITNFLEGDLFAWYLPAWSEDIEDLVRKMTARLDQYNPGTLAEEPAESRDMLKKLYHQLFPKSVRHDLGEYYTPDWLADHVLNELGYVGDPDKRLLDPACGSGTFLVMAITRIRSWYEKNREKLRYDEGELCKKILANVVGFDLNPLAVMAARTNYLIAIRGLVSHVDQVEIPVYLCDSIMTPSEYGEAKQEEMFGRPMKLRTSAKPSPFFIPREVVSDAQVLAAYTNKLQSLAAKNSGYSADEFLEQCRNDGVPVTSLDDHKRLFGELRKLDEDDKNGIWARIIKNAFAPLFIGKVDYVAGNPPWVFWNNLPDEYRDSVRQLMADTYRITAKGASTMKRLGSAGKDLSMLFFYVGLDAYLNDGGRLGYVITQTLFQTTAGNEFRRFRLPGGRQVGVRKVEDWVQVEPFRPKAGNKTAVVIADTLGATKYPIPYPVYRPIADFDRESALWAEVTKACDRFDGTARPHDSTDPTSFWIIESDGAAGIAASGAGIYSARLGIETKLESAFSVKIIKQVGKKLVLVENVLERAKKPVPQITATVEAALLFPFVTGASISRWKFDVQGYYIVPHTPETGMEPIPIEEMKRTYPKAYEYFHGFKGQLQSRSLHQRWGKGKPFYSLYDIGEYTFAPYKVAWKRSTKDFSAVVLATIDDEVLGERVVLPNGNVMMVAFDQEEQAYFLCGLLNSTYARARMNASITTKAHRDIINVVPLEKYDAKRKDHRRIVKLAKDAHDAAQREELGEVRAIEEQLDEAVTELWGDRKATKSVASKQ